MTSAFADNQIGDDLRPESKSLRDGLRDMNAGFGRSFLEESFEVGISGNKEEPLGVHRSAPCCRLHQNHRDQA